MKFWLAFIVMLFMTACASKPQGASAVPENLLVKCLPLQPVTGYDGKAAQSWMTTAALVYNACMGRHNRLVDAVRLANPRHVTGKEPTGTVEAPE